jgi:protease-4
MNFIHESIFVSAIRTFTKVLFGIIGAAIAIFMMLVGAGLLSSPYIDPFRPQLILGLDENGSSQILPSAPVILKISVEGVIGTKRLNTEMVSQALMKSRQVIKPERIKGIFLTINSPGGTSLDSSGIYHAIQDYKKKYNIPVYAFVDGLCASGGMYIACAADQIFSSQESIIGSVGVRLGPVFNFSTVMEKIGINALTITQGKDKDSFNPFRPWNENEGEDIKNLIKDSYKIFVDVVSGARPKLTADLLTNSLGAQIFSASKAFELGYVDSFNSNYFSALKTLRENCGIKDDTPYQVLEVVQYKSPFENFVDAKLKLFSKSFQEQMTHIETKNPVCDRVLYLMDF